MEQFEMVKNKKNYSSLELAGLIKTSEFSWELAWKTIKDFLTHQGLDVTGPRDAIKQGFKNGLLTEDEAWLDMLEARNLMAHIDDEDQSGKVKKVICEKYFGLLEDLHQRLKEKL